ncbi:MAG: metallophosphoesterase, partial [Clostridia bacterium]|nr:metallophosphoesterase [Clostridia bacterium]
MAKIFHCADLHLDSPFTSLTAEKSRILRQSVLTAFSKAVDRAASDGCDLMLIAGDLFDSDFVTAKTLETVCAKLSSHPEL